MIGPANEVRQGLRPALEIASALGCFSTQSPVLDDLVERELSGPAGVSAVTEVIDLGIADDMLPQVSAALLLLLESFNYARSVAQDPWEFSVELSELQRLGLTCNNGRWLIHQGLVHHARETTRLEDGKRRFVSCCNLSLKGNTCFILTQEGRQLACRMVDAHRAAIPAAAPSVISAAGRAPSNNVRADGLIVPKWDRARRQLRVGVTIVKEFKVPAANQEIILAVFEEEHWPPRIDDPLPRDPNIDRQRRLHDTINSLNRRQRRNLIRFGADGVGQGIRWEWSKDAAPRNRPLCQHSATA